MSDPIHQWLARITARMSRVAGALILLIAVLITADVFMRNLWNIAPLHSFELGTLLFAVAVALGLPHAMLTGANIRIDLLNRFFPPPLRRGLDLLALLSMTWLGGTLGWFAARLAWSSGLRDVRTGSALNAPLVWPQAIWAAGFILLGVTSLVLVWRHLVMLRRGDGEIADVIIGLQDEAADAVAEATDQEKHP